MRGGMAVRYVNKPSNSCYGCSGCFICSYRNK